MMIIREKQIEILSQFMLKQFRNRMMVHLCTCFPENTQNIEDATLQTMIETGLEQAAEYGVTTEDDVRRYLEYVVIHSTNIDTNPEIPWMCEILEDESLNGTEKMNSIDDVTLFSMMR